LAGIRQLTGYARETIAAIAEHAASGDSGAQKAVQALEALHECQSLSFKHVEDKLEELRTSIRNPSSSGADTIPAVAFLDTLEFRGMHEREEFVSVAHARTFDWLLADVDSSISLEQGPEIQAERQNLRQTISEGLKNAGVNDKEIGKVLPAEKNDHNPPGGPLQQWLRSGSGVL
jgi:hypothetical protein